MLPGLAQPYSSAQVNDLVARNEVPVKPYDGSRDRALAISDAMEFLIGDKVGKAGVAALPLEGGVPILLNAEELFPMASTVKVPIAMALLAKVDAGEIELDTLEEINDYEWVFSDVVASEFLHPGVALSVANLIELMITHSDNTTTDVCLRLAGGTAAVDSYVASLKIDGMNISRYMRDLVKDFYGLPSGRENIEKAKEFVEKYPEKVIAPSEIIENDPRDQSTPDAMLELLLQLANGKALSPESTQFLLDVMSRTTTNVGRLKGLLPSNTVVGNKTGTVGGVANDVGYIQLPKTGNQLPKTQKVAIVVFTKSSATPPEDRERAIAEIGRLLFDVYLTE